MTFKKVGFWLLDKKNVSFHVLESYCHCSASDSSYSDVCDAILVTNISDFDNQLYHSLTVGFGGNHFPCLFLICQRKFIISCITCQVVGGLER